MGLNKFAKFAEGVFEINADKQCGRDGMNELGAGWNVEESKDDFCLEETRLEILLPDKRFWAG